MLPMMENRDDLIRQELDFFRHLVDKSDAGPHKDWETRANGLDGLLPDEKFYLRFVEKNFDGGQLNRWVVFGQKPNNQRYRGKKPIFTIMTIEVPGEAGSFGIPADIHLDSLRVLILDWREGRHAALQRMEGLKEKAQETKLKDALNEASGRVDDIFWFWKRATGEDMNFCLGADGLGPNQGGKHFGSAFDRNKPASRIIVP
tara:strand:- start:1404 stop:2009 length:606 start_codon:yes stop_codon:yes gene_type:complete